MIERLAMCLRNYNFDTVLWTQKSRKDLVQFAEEEKRILISRDNSLLNQKKNCVSFPLIMNPRCSPI